jgi:hypothetical protein
MPAFTKADKKGYPNEDELSSNYLCTNHLLGFHLFHHSFKNTKKIQGKDITVHLNICNI